MCVIEQHPMPIAQKKETNKICRTGPATVVLPAAVKCLVTEMIMVHLFSLPVSLEFAGLWCLTGTGGPGCLPALRALL